MRDGKHLMRFSGVPPSFNSLPSRWKAPVLVDRISFGLTGDKRKLPHRHWRFKPIRKFRQWELDNIFKIQAHQRKKNLYITMMIRWFKWAKRCYSSECALQRLRARISAALPVTLNLILCGLPQTFNKNSGIVIFRIYTAANISRVLSPGIWCHKFWHKFSTFSEETAASFFRAENDSSSQRHITAYNSLLGYNLVMRHAHCLLNFSYICVFPILYNTIQFLQLKYNRQTA